MGRAWASPTRPRESALTRALVNLPTDRDALDLVARDGEEPAQDVSPVVDDAEGRVGIVLPGN